MKILIWTNWSCFYSHGVFTIYLVVYRAWAIVFWSPSIVVQFFLQLMYILCHYHLFLPSVHSKYLYFFGENCTFCIYFTLLILFSLSLSLSLSHSSRYCFHGNEEPWEGNSWWTCVYFLPTVPISTTYCVHWGVAGRKNQELVYILRHCLVCSV